LAVIEEVRGGGTAGGGWGRRGGVSRGVAEPEERKTRSRGGEYAVARTPYRATGRAIWGSHQKVDESFVAFTN
jgi:hypothetical protein